MYITLILALCHFLSHDMLTLEPDLHTESDRPGFTHLPTEMFGGGDAETQGRILEPTGVSALGGGRTDTVLGARPSSS